MSYKPRRTTYKDWMTKEGLLKLEGWARDGLTDEQIAHNIGIARPTLYNWKYEHKEIDDALKKGKEVVDRQVENALLKRALGYEVTETKIEESNEGEKVTTTVKHIQPDTTAQIFWLKNRKPLEWRDRKNLELAGEVNTHNPFSELTTDELRKLIEK